MPKSVGGPKRSIETKFSHLALGSKGHAAESRPLTGGMLLFGTLNFLLHEIEHLSKFLIYALFSNIFEKFVTLNYSPYKNSYPNAKFQPEKFNPKI